MDSQNIWDNLDSDNTFRLVFTDYQNPNQSFNFYHYILRLVNWRNHQNCQQPDLYVIKLGYSNFIENYSLDNITNFFLEHNDIFNNKPVRFSIYQHINSISNFLFLEQYAVMANMLKGYNIYCTICWVFDLLTFEEDSFNHNLFIQYLQEKTNDDLHHVILFHNINYVNLSDIQFNILNLYEQLNNTHQIVGYDITSHIHNLSLERNHYKHNLLPFSEFLLEHSPEFLHKIMPEFKELYSNNNNNSQTLSEQIKEFCQNGFIIDINNNTISPLIYGAADDFSYTSSLTVNDFLLLILSEVSSYFEKHLTKLFLKSFCFQCEHLQQCQTQKIYWLNIPSTNNCSLSLPNLLNK